jgi:hypothetical protein
VEPSPDNKLSVEARQARDSKRLARKKLYEQSKARGESRGWEIQPSGGPMGIPVWQLILGGKHSPIPRREA